MNSLSYIACWRMLNVNILPSFSGAWSGPLRKIFSLPDWGWRPGCQSLATMWGRNWIWQSAWCMPTLHGAWNLPPSFSGGPAVPKASKSFHLPCLQNKTPATWKSDSLEREENHRVSNRVSNLSYEKTLYCPVLVGILLLVTKTSHLPT